MSDRSEHTLTRVQAASALCTRICGTVLRHEPRLSASSNFNRLGTAPGGRPPSLYSGGPSGGQRPRSAATPPQPLKLLLGLQLLPPRILSTTRMPRHPAPPIAHRSVQKLRIRQTRARKCQKRRPGAARTKPAKASGLKVHPKHLFQRAVALLAVPRVPPPTSRRRQVITHSPLLPSSVVVVGPLPVPKHDTLNGSRGTFVTTSTPKRRRDPEPTDELAQHIPEAHLRKRTRHTAARRMRSERGLRLPTQRRVRKVTSLKAP
jgi:hypothetical protein